MIYAYDALNRLSTATAKTLGGQPDDDLEPDHQIRPVGQYAL
jgi:hypothetical protein